MSYKIYQDCKSEYALFTWSIPKVFFNDNLNVDSCNFGMKSMYIYYANFRVSEDKISFTIGSNAPNLKCLVSLFIGSEMLFSNTLNEPTRSKSETSPCFDYFDLVTFSHEDECFQKLKQHPNDTLVLICRIKCSFDAKPISVSSSTTAMNTLCNLKKLASALKNSPESFVNEKVILQVGDENELVSKAVLCGRSPVFAKMFQNDMKELKENRVVVTDIKMSVLQDFVAFLYTGQLTNKDFGFVCELYYASDKYDVADLRQACIDLISPLISMKNMIQVLKLAFTHNDEQLKSTAMTIITKNIETWVSTDDWKILINEEPKIAVEVLNFFDF